MNIVFGQQGNSCIDPIDLNPFIPTSGNGVHNITVDNALSSQFYTYTATQEGVIEMSSAYSYSSGSSNFDTWLRVYDSDCNLIFDEDDTPGLLGGVEYTVEVSVGDTYVFEWSNQEWAGVFNVEFIYQEKITEGVTCDNPINVILGEANNLANYWFGAQYYTYTATENGVFEVSTCNGVYAHNRVITLLDACNGNSIGVLDESCDVDDDGYSLVRYSISIGETVVVKMVGLTAHMHDDYYFSASFIGNDNIYIPDSEFEKRLINTGVDTTGLLDGYILKHDAEAVTGVLNTSLEVDGVLTDYTGIEAFVNMTGFVVVNVSDRVTSLDLSNNILLEEIEIAYITDFPDFDFTANTNLRILKIDADGWQPINNLNINGLTQLEELNIYKSNFNSLDLSTNTALNKLTIEYSSNLSTLDLSSNVLLNRLFVSECNNLASINISNGSNESITNFNISDNTNLICVQVDDTSYSNTNWINKDTQTAYSNTVCIVAIPDTEFEKRLIALGVDTTGVLDGYILRSDAENVTGILDLTDNYTSPLTDLTGIEAFINLTGIAAYNPGDSIAILDLSFCTELEVIDLNEATTISNFNFSSNTKLKTLFVSDFDSVNITGLTSLTEVYLENYTNTGLDVSTNSSLEVLEISGAPNMVSLDLSTCPNITELSLSFFASIQNLNLVGLNQLSNLELYNTGAEFSYLDLSSSFPSLTSVSLSQNNFSVITFDNLAQLEYLSINDNFLLQSSLDLSLTSSLLYIGIESTGVRSINIANGVNTNITQANFNITNNPNLTCVQVDETTYSNTNWPNKDAQTVYSEAPCNALFVRAKVYLQGAALNPIIGEEELMRDDLRAGTHLPIVSPYADAFITDPLFFNAGGFSGTSGPFDDIIDWVWVELRNKDDNTIVIDSQSGLLQRDGDIVSPVDAYSPLNFDQPNGDYYVAIKHRNHLGVMSANAIALSGIMNSVDFTNANNQITYGNNAQTTFGMPNGIVAMWAGNVGGDTSIKYSGSGNDATGIKDKILAEPGNASNSNLYSFIGYNIGDINLDGTIKYQGSGNDTTILKDIILAHPDNLITPSNLFEIQEQIPSN